MLENKVLKFLIIGGMSGFLFAVIKASFLSGSDVYIIGFPILFGMFLGLIVYVISVLININENLKLIHEEKKDINK